MGGIKSETALCKIQQMFVIFAVFYNVNVYFACSSICNR